nr:ribulose-phosphate 3-epimerase [Tissierella sp.]
MAKLSPSLLSANFAELKNEIEKLENGGADYLHLDVMDGNYVPNISFGAPVIKSIKKVTKLPLDVHLMIDKPERYIQDFVDAGADIITVHGESTTHIHRVIQMIKSSGVKAGLSLNPATSLESLEYLISDLDLILIMSVNPGFGGQSFIPAIKNKIKETRKLIDSESLDIILQVDGGIKTDNIEEIVELGADLIVVGSDIFKARDLESRVKEFKDLIAK